ncbi:peroxidase superfamily protein [Carex rostrata]
MERFSVLFFLLLFTSACVQKAKADGILSTYYYQELCPIAEEIIRQHVETEVYQDPNVAAQLLRLHFHDCFVMGCDASILLDDFEGIESEKNAGPNLNSLRGFEVIDRMKYALEIACPGIVSCADIIAIAARDAVVSRGGPSWEVFLGRKDSLKASFYEANKRIPAPNSTLEILIANFEDHGLEIVDLVSLSGAHTIGRSRCTSFKQRLYNPQPFEEVWDVRQHEYFQLLRSICPEEGHDNDLVPLDIKTPRRFDNLYYVNLLRGHSLLTSDSQLVTEDTVEYIVSNLVWQYAFDQRLFFEHFVNSMIKMGNIGVLTVEGEVRHNCRYIN